MKKPDTTNAIPSARDIADFKDNDLWKRYFDLEEVFDLDPRVIRELRPSYPAHLEWQQVLDLIGRELAEMAGYPCTMNDQQPYDMVHTCPLSLSPDMYDTPEEHDVAMQLHWLWARSIIHHCKGKDIDVINRHIWLMNFRLVYIFIGLTKESAFRLINSIEWLNNLRIQHGLHDIPSGQLIDREEYTLRQLILDLSELTGQAQLITGDMLETAGLKARLFNGGCSMIEASKIEWGSEEALRESVDAYMADKYNQIAQWTGAKLVSVPTSAFTPKPRPDTRYKLKSAGDVLRSDPIK